MAAEVPGVEADSIADRPSTCSVGAEELEEADL